MPLLIKYPLQWQKYKLRLDYGEIVATEAGHHSFYESLQIKIKG